MRAAFVGVVLVSLVAPGWAQTPSPNLPTPATPGPNPGAAATEAVTSPTKPTETAPAIGAGSTPGDASPGTRAPVAPPAVVPPAPPAQAGTGGMSPGEMRELLDAARATAKASRESVEYGRVVPDILQQILAKLDKIEDKLDKVENAVKAQGRGRR
ncbi:hypothetical protein [Enterovirga aerilata]|uniref:Uncharacterized protein n=1 Tax=Enterovirga aerilata TaxID=2730920 RepID=A0A849IEY0_9HYPH|nr:hypothetical protein [Enterovirga sp. DB1703]NNM74527.1 hypothetical protein [Enterovirga sp. DB1703]